MVGCNPSQLNNIKGVNMIYEIIKEYKYYYLCESPYGWKECFSKALHKPNEKGQIIINKIIVEGHSIDTSKVNRVFNKIKY